MNNCTPGIPGIIREVIPEATHGGTTYTQTVKIGLSDGSEFDLYDEKMTINEENIGDNVQVVVATQERPYVEAPELDIPTIKPATEPSTKWSYDLCGTVESINPTTECVSHPSEQSIVLDLGVGSLFVEPKGETRTRIERGEITVGDHICLTGSRANLLDVELLS